MNKELEEIEFDLYGESLIHWGYENSKTPKLTLIEWDKMQQALDELYEVEMFQNIDETDSGACYYIDYSEVWEQADNKDVFKKLDELGFLR